MAKKAAAKLRVHQLAKELGVSSKDIVAKCRAEDIPGIENHMSPVNFGLAATVREWFGVSESSAATALETAAPVEVATKTKAKAKARSKPATARAAETKEAATTDVAASAPAATATATSAGGDTPTESSVATEVAAPPPTPEAPVDDVVVADPPAESTSVDAEPEPSTAEAPSESAAEPVVAAEAPVDGDSDDLDEDGKSKVTMNVPTRPKVVKPVGPMLEVPKKISLAGPRVIRVEAPEVLPTPTRARERRGGGPSYGGGGAGAGGPMGAPPGGGGGGAPGRGISTRRNKRRSGSGEGGGRMGRAFSNDQQPFEPWREQDLMEREHRLSRARGFIRSHRRDAKKGGGGGGGRAQAARPEGPVRIAEPITIKELSAATGVKAADILRKLILNGVMATINSTIETDHAIEVMLEFGLELEVQEQKSAEEKVEQQFEARERVDERRRDPVVTILGHVDHGKTSLLDRVRSTNVASGEAGGITQATSAFRVPVQAGDKEHMVTFIDTPGHEAFTGMRARGAKVTDVAVLVVAADDGVMPQTIESINHVKAAEVPLVVALNKIDKAEATDANITRILGQLAEHGLNPVEWGGETEVIRTSAIEGTGIQDLLDILDYQSDLRELKADFDGSAVGTVLEAQMEEGRGPVARLLVQEGCLKKGNFVVIGRSFGRVRDIIDDRGNRIEEAYPSMPVAVSGLDVLPDAGDRMFAVNSLKEAEAAAAERKRAERERELAAPKVTLDNIFDRIAESQKKELPLVVKADVQGSLETLKAVLGKSSTEEVTVSLKHAAVGGINESDVTLAEATGAIIIGFNVTSSSKARQAADQKGIDIRLYDVIYDITDDLSKAIVGLLEPELKLEVLGHAEVREVFRISKVGAVAGCYVTDGVIERNAQIRVTRDGIVVEKDRRLEQLKRFKDDAREVRSGQECGMKINGYDDIKEGDVLECYKTVQVARTL